MTTPVRLQISRRKGFNLQKLSRETNGLAAIVVTRRGKYGNPFRVGGWFAIGAMGMSWCECLMPDDPKMREGFTKIETRQMAVEWFREYRRRHPLSAEQKEELRGHNLACTCPIDQPHCHANALIELANT